MEPIFHVIIPSLLLMAFFPQINKRAVIITGFIVEFMMDFDSLFGVEWHRILTHNIIWAAMVGLIFLAIKGKAWARPAWFFAFTHLLFDLRDFGVALFWPFIQKTFALYITISESNPWFFKIEPKAFSFEELRAAVYPWTLLDSWGAYIIIAIALMLLYKFWKRK